MATATMLFEHNWGVAGIHTVSLRSDGLWIAGTCQLALWAISYFGPVQQAWDLPFSSVDPPGSG